MQRKVVKVFWKNAETSKVWREILLPLGPVGTGGIMAGLMVNYPYPDDFQNFGGRVVFGMVAGLASAHVYSMLKGFLKARSGSDAELLPPTK